MNVRIKQLIDQIKNLEDELSDELHQQENQLLFQLKKNNCTWMSN